MAAFQIPPYMQKGSRGTAVVLLQVFLCGLGLGGEIETDGIYGDVTAYAVGQFQATNNLDPDGNWGPKTRQIAQERYNFDFDRAYAATIVEDVIQTTFIQPEGPAISV